MARARSKSAERPTGEEKEEKYQSEHKVGESFSGVGGKRANDEGVPTPLRPRCRSRPSVSEMQPSVVSGNVPPVGLSPASLGAQSVLGLLKELGTGLHLLLRYELSKVMLSYPSDDVY